jgi:hypothetical protein
MVGLGEEGVGGAVGVPARRTAGGVLSDACGGIQSVSCRCFEKSRLNKLMLVDDDNL